VNRAGQSQIKFVRAYALPTWPIKKKMKERIMKRKRELEAAYPKQLKDKKGPSYAEGLESVQSRYDDIRRSKATEESSIRNSLSSAFQIPVEIVDEYLCFGEYISMPVLKTLAESKVDKHFFDRAQKVKRQLVKFYRHDELSDQKIMAKVSQAILEMYREYIEKGKFNTKDWRRFLMGGNGINNSRNLKTNKSTARKSKIFKYWSGAQKPSEVRPVNLNEINHMLDDVYQGIENINIFDGAKLSIEADKVKKQCLSLAKIHHLMLELESKQSRNQRRRAA
jgi:hypothetical protein